jgi:hypothetical protein
MTTFKILVLEQSGNENELCQVGSNPAAVVQAALRKTIAVQVGRRWKRVPMYRGARFVEVEE